MSPSDLQAWMREARRRGGRWRLTPSHEIEYRSEEGGAEALMLRGPIVAAEPGSLVFAASRSEKDGKSVTRLIRLEGQWTVDRANRIVFEVENQAGRQDRLVFGSSWKLNDRYELVYRYRVSALKTRRRLERELVFSGRWEMADRAHLVFLVGDDDRSRLRFRGSFQTPSILAKRGEIRYQIGAEFVSGARAQTLVFFGRWKISRTLGLSFELDAPGGRARALDFGAEWHFDGSRRVSAHLRARSGEPLGVEVEFGRSWGEGEWFVRGLHSPVESRVEAGARWSV